MFATLTEAIGNPFKDLFAGLPPDYADLLPMPKPRPTAEEFFAQVQLAGRINSRDQAQRAVHATLQALADRVSAGQANEIALHLPAEVRADLMGAEEQAQPFSLNEFLDRIATIESIDHATAELHAQAVLTAVRVHVPGREWADTLGQLPSDIGRLAR